MKIAFRIDSDPHHSPSRLCRALALSSGIKDTDPSCEITFLLTGPQPCEDIVKAEGHACRHFGISSMPAWNVEVTGNALEELKSDLLIVDDYGIDERYLREMRSKAFLVVVDDCMQLKSYSANGIVNPNPNAHTLQYRSDGGELFLGTEFTPIPKEFDDYQDCPRENPERVKRIIVSFPGADRSGATLEAVRALKSLKSKFIADIYVGKEFERGEDLASETGLDDRFIFMNDGPGKARRMAAADFAITAPDITFHELMMLRIPTAIIADKGIPEQPILGEYAGMNGFALYLGEAGELGDAGKTMGDFLANQEGRQRMSVRVGELVDGLGRFRLADEILRLGNP
jgi:spore coat polysaccharide biosynthesis predicted glycosyltransferase SpsG